MSNDMQPNLTDIDVALAELEVMQSAFARIKASLVTLRETSLQNRLSRLPPCEVPVTDHRREHRMGRVPKIDTDPEMQAFILARCDRLTYDEIAKDVAAHFPPTRHVHRATIHRWVQRRRKEQ